MRDTQFVCDPELFEICPCVDGLAGPPKVGVTPPSPFECLCRFEGPGHGHAGTRCSGCSADLILIDVETGAKIDLPVKRRRLH